MPTSTYWEQAERTVTESDGAKTITVVYRGDYSALATYAGTFVFGTSTEDGVDLTSKTLTRTVGDPNLGVLRLEYSEETDDDSGSRNAKRRSTNWSMKHTQRIVSLMRHTGDSASMPHRGNLEAWSHEPDPSLYDAFQYRNQVGAVLTLSLPEQAVAAKLKAGVEGAMRFYPTIQKVSTYSKGKIANVGSGLAHVSTPGSPWDSVATSWLKVGDDVTLDARAGIQTRTESWIGAKSWDVNLYGESPDRWEELDNG